MNLRKKLNLNKVQAIAFYATIALTIFGIVETLFHINADVPASKIMFTCLGYLVILYYVIFGYKIPHGNSLKYVILFFAFILVNEMALEAGGKYPNLDSQTILLSTILTSICIIIVSYLSGRLDKFEKNNSLFVIVMILLIARALLMHSYKNIMFSNFADVIIWIDINWVYSLRFIQHKDAGANQ